MAKGKGKKKTAPGDVATNRQARHRFNLLDTYEAGIVLRGTEVKALRNGGATLKDAYATVRDGEVWLHHLHIPPYAPAYHDNHEPERDRKLLLHRREIEKLVGTTKERGLTLVPMRLYFKGPKAKVEIALAQGKDRFDKRESIKAREMGREMQRAVRDAERR
jgi:SsrA-binding protein